MSDVNIVMMMFFEIFLLRKISEFPSVRVPIWNSEIFPSKNNTKNIIITTLATISDACFFVPIDERTN